jgi:hypothetical protein
MGEGNALVKYIEVPISVTWVSKFFLSKGKTLFTTKTRIVVNRMKRSALE